MPSVDISLWKKMKEKKIFVQILLQQTRSYKPLDTIFETQLDGTQTLRTVLPGFGTKKAVFSSVKSRI